MDSPKAPVIEPQAATLRPTSAASTWASSAISENVFDRSDVSEAAAPYTKSKDRQSHPYTSSFDIAMEHTRKTLAENDYATGGSDAVPQRSYEHYGDVQPRFPQSATSLSHASQAQARSLYLQSAPPLASTDSKSSAYTISGGERPAATFPSSAPMFNRTYSDVLMGPPSVRRPMQPRPHSARVGDTTSISNDESFPTVRPVTEPVPQSPMTLSQLIPRRDLPFNKPLRSASVFREADGTSARRASSALELSPLPRPALIGEMGRSSITERTFDMPNKRRLSVAGSVDDIRKSPTKLSSAEKNTNIGVSHDRRLLAEPGSSVRSTENKVAASQLPLRQLSQSESNVLRSSALLGVVEQAKDVTSLLSPWAKYPSPREAAPLDTSGFMQALFTETSNLAEYVSLSAEDRQKIIQDMICQNLADENFLKLCDDINGEWRRIGFDI